LSSKAFHKQFVTCNVTPRLRNWHRKKLRFCL